MKYLRSSLFSGNMFSFIVPIIAVKGATRIPILDATDVSRPPVRVHSSCFAGFVAKAGSDSRAFTRVELLCCVLGVVWLLGVALPIVAGNNPRSELAACMNNLRRIGIGMNMWASDHGDRKPWWTPRVEGGSYVNPKSGNSWFEFAYLSNYLASPKILICPSDPPRNAAADWGFGPGGIFYTGNRNNSISYIVGLHAVRDNPESWLSGDRNLRYGSGPEGCATGIQNAWSLNTTDPMQGWTNSIHGLKGNLLLNSGEAKTVDNKGFVEALARHLDTLRSENNMVHFLPSY